MAMHSRTQDEEDLPHATKNLELSIGWMLTCPAGPPPAIRKSRMQMVVDAFRETLELGLAKPQQTVRWTANYREFLDARAGSRGLCSGLAQAIWISDICGEVSRFSWGLWGLLFLPAWGDFGIGVCANKVPQILPDLRGVLEGQSGDKTLAITNLDGLATLFHNLPQGSCLDFISACTKPLPASFPDFSGVPKERRDSNCRNLEGMTNLDGLATPFHKLSLDVSEVKEEEKRQ
ncbi:hypothetical protein K438DRAFT_1752446 [Mycena galopus ATCC 62051]|nr:hypothetical protein K438DRAFT_1752446 [Mycena galopus ATCC 62051]